MNKHLIITGVGAVVVILVLVMAFGGGSSPSTPAGQTGAADNTPTEGVLGPPFIDMVDFKIYFEKYLQGNCPDPTRITATLKKNPTWAQELLPDNFDQSYAAMKARTYTIIFHFITAEDIKRTRLLQAVVFAEKKPRDVITLLDRGASINEPGVITKAVSPEMLEFLLAKGANPNVPDENGILAYDLTDSPTMKVQRLILEKHGAHGKSK